VQAVFHCAANVKHFGHYREFVADNVAATRRLLKLAAHRSANPADFHLVSTLSVCGKAPEEGFRLFTEYDAAPQALDENSADGEKARAMLARLHVTLYDATTGGVKPTAQALQDIGAALAVLPAGAERDAAAMALFKRAGLEAIPVMVELGANLKTAKEKGYGPSDEEIERYLRYQRTVTQIATDWAAAVAAVSDAASAAAMRNLAIMKKFSFPGAFAKRPAENRLQAPCYRIVTRMRFLLWQPAAGAGRRQRSSNCTSGRSG